MKKTVTLSVALCVAALSHAYARITDVASASFAFTENNGQVVDQFYHSRNDIRFRLANGGMNVFIGNGQLHYQWNRELTGGNTDIYRLDVVLEGANAHAAAITEQPQPGYDRYYLPQCPNGAIAYSYKKITYKNIYPNIDWVLYTTGDHLKYDFIVHEGGNPSDIKLTYNGTTSLLLDKGAVTATTPFGSITEDAPYSYNAETKAPVSTSFVQDHNTIGFSVAAHDGTLVIDPGITLSWATNYGGTSTDDAAGAAADNAGNVIVTGSSYSTANMATTGAYQTTIAGGRDAFLVKLSDAGTRLWATYYGGPADDYFADVAYDAASGSIYCTGSTQSTSGIATPGTHKPTFTNPSNYVDAMLVKFDSAGARQWGTYYGGKAEEMASSVALDPSGYVYIGGSTWSDTGIATPGAHLTAEPGGILYTGYIAKFNSSGIRQWGTYYGGKEIDMLYDIACDKNGNVIAVGHTRSDTGIATPGAYLTSYQSAMNPGMEDGFVVKFNSAGVRQWGTYYGGGGLGNSVGRDIVNSVALDTAGHIYIAGYTNSQSGIGTSGTFAPTQGFIYSGFLAQMNSTGFPQWGTYYYPLNSIVCNPKGDIFASVGPNIYGGVTHSKIQIARFDNTGNLNSTADTITLSAQNTQVTLAYSPKNGKLYGAHTVVANTAATAGAHQVTYGGGASDGFITAWQVDSVADHVDTTSSVAALHSAIPLGLYPNPNKGSFTVQAHVPGATTNGNVLLEVVNVTGAVVYKENAATVNGRLDKQLKLDLPNGLYMLRIGDGEVAGRLKFTVCE